MESSKGQPDIERLPAAFGVSSTTLAKSGSETAQYDTPGVGTGDLLPPSAPPNGCSTNEATISTGPSTSLPSSSLPTTKTLEEILTHEGATGQVVPAASLEEVLRSHKMSEEEKEPPAKRLKIDTLNGSEGELIAPLPEKPDLPEDQTQLSSLISPEALLSQRTLSQSSSLSDSTNPDTSTLSPDIQTTLAQLNTSNLDIATRRTILLGRTKNKYVCEVCRRECPSKHKLKRHLSTHSEERPFSCQICGKSFKWTEYLQKHMRQQHPGGVEGSPSQSGNSQTPSKPHLQCSHSSPMLASPSQHQLANSSSSISSVNPLSSPSLKSPTAPSPTNLSSLSSRSELQNTTQRSQQAPKTVDSGITVNMDDVLTSSSSLDQPSSQQQSDSGIPKPTKQNASVGVNMDEEEAELAAKALKSAAHLTPLEGLTINHSNLSVSVGGAHLIAQSSEQLVGGAIIDDGGGAQVVVGSGGTIADVGTSVGGGGMDITTGINMQVGRGGVATNAHHIAMDSSGMCYATASISQPLTTFTNGSAHQQQTVMGSGGILQGYSDGSMQTTGHMGQQGNPLQQSQQPPSQQYPQEMLQQSLTVASTCAVQEMNDPNSIPSSVQYSIPDHQQQQQTMQVYADQQMTNSHSMSEHDPNSMSVGGLHSMTPPDLIRDAQQLAMPVPVPPSNTDTVMMQDMSAHQQHMPQYTTYPMQDPMGTTIYGTESDVTAPSIQQTSGVMPQSLGTQYPQVTHGPAPGQMALDSSNAIVNSVAQAQNNNVYASVASYETLDMQSQETVGIVNYSNSQQNMMVQTQTDMMGGFGVIHNGLMQGQQDMGVGVMDPTMYSGTSAGSGSSGGNNGGGIGAGGGGGSGTQGMMMTESQKQQADNFISQQIKKHMMHSQTQQLQSHDSHVTQMQDHMTGQQLQDSMSQHSSLGQDGATNPGGESNKTVDEKPKLVKVIIVHEDDPTVERYPVMQKSKKVTIEIGIQCELGPETIKALVEEEKALEAKERPVDTTMEDDDGCLTDEENSNDRTVQKYPCEMDNCGKAYIHRKDLIRHMKIRHGQSPLKLEPVTVEAREKPYVCPVGHCGRSYYHQKDLRRHQRLCHKANMEPKTTSVLKDNVEVDEECKTQLRYPCDFPSCLRSYVHKKDLVRHKRLFHKDTASKPTIPIPVRYTESELKRIKQEVKQEIDKSIEKIRLDSTGSTVSNATANSGDDPPNSSLIVEPEAELSSLNQTLDGNPNNLSASEQSAVNVTLPAVSASGVSPQFVLYIDPNAPTSTATLVPASSTTQSSSQSSTALFTGSSPCITTEALSVQNISKALLSTMTANLPQGQAQLDSTASLLKMATGEHVDQSLITSEVASILGALEQAHYRQQQQQAQQQQQLTHSLEQQEQQQDGSSSGQQQSLSTLPPDILNMASFVSTSISSPSTTITTTTVSGASTESQQDTTIVNNPVDAATKNTSVIESLESEMTITEGSTLAESVAATASLHQLFSGNANQEQSSEMSTATESSC